MFSDAESFLEILDRLTPKIEGDQWLINFVDPELSFLSQYMQDTKIIPDYISCVLYVPHDKLDALAEQYPELRVQKESNWSLYLKLVSGLQHVMLSNAYSYLYRCIGPGLDDLKAALVKLDSECEGDIITLSAVKKAFPVAKRVYASEVFRAFYNHDPARWKLYRQYTEDLGPRISYYAMRKVVVELLKAKQLYLQNKDTKNRLVTEIDAPYACKAYVLFVYNESVYQLPAIMHMLECEGLPEPHYIL